MDSSSLGAASALAAGAVSFLSPCVLPLVPAYVSYITGRSLSSDPTAASRGFAAWLALCFVLGFSAVFIALGASATALGRLLLQHRYEANLAGGAIVIVFGLVMLGTGRGTPWVMRDFRFHPPLAGGRPLPAFVLGAAFGFGWTPCIGPVLGAILTVSAAQTTVSGGVGLLALYAAGLGVPFLLVAALGRELASRLKRLRRVGAALQIAAGAVMVLMGAAMMTGRLSAFGYWLLETFPALGRIG